MKTRFEQIGMGYGASTRKNGKLQVGRIILLVLTRVCKKTCWEIGRRFESKTHSHYFSYFTRQLSHLFRCLVINWFSGRGSGYGQGLRLALILAKGRPLSGKKRMRPLRYQTYRSEIHHGQPDVNDRSFHRVVEGGGHLP